jgi:hypothetical protein
VKKKRPTLKPIYPRFGGVVWAERDNKKSLIGILKNQI